MPATKTTKSSQDMHAEIESLRKEVAEMMTLLKDKGSDVAETISEKTGEKFGDYQEKVQEGAEVAYEKGLEGVEEVSKRVKKNPVASLCIAFGLGYAISKLIDQGK
ncbi:DUF883 family protein [Leucothrix sargassi]|nr:DUF883 family protein [Leucothrix sargassi]